MADPQVTAVFVKAAQPAGLPWISRNSPNFVDADAKRLIPVIKKIGRLDEK